MRGYYEEMRTILERHGGTVEKFIGDAVMAVFGVPVSHEDDALRAVRAAWEMRAAVPALGLQARIGVNTGEVVAGEGDTLVTGDAVNVAARLEQAADAGRGADRRETRRLVRDAVRSSRYEVTAEGQAGAGRGLSSARRRSRGGGDRAAARHAARRPRASSSSSCDRPSSATVREQRCHLFTLLGPAGVGKSRLVAEFLARPRRDSRRAVAASTTARASRSGRSISVLKQLGPRADATLARSSRGVELPNELFCRRADVRSRTLAAERSARRRLRRHPLGRADVPRSDRPHRRPLARRADPVLCLARPELLDKRPGWGGGKLNATTILLEPLTAAECTELIDGARRRRGRHAVRASWRRPTGIRCSSRRWSRSRARTATSRVPSTVQALLQARLDQLGRRGASRDRARRGRRARSSTAAPCLELTRRHRTSSRSSIGLVRKELIHPAPATLAGDQAFRFRHLLIRDAAYDGAAEGDAGRPARALRRLARVARAAS